MFNHKQLGAALLMAAGMGEFENETRTLAPLRIPVGYPKRKVRSRTWYRQAESVGGLGDIDRSFRDSVSRRLAAQQLAEECFSRPEDDSIELAHDPEDEMIDAIDAQARVVNDRESFEDLGDDEPVSGVFSKYDELTDKLAAACR